MSGEEFSDWYMYIYSVSCLVELTLAVKYIYFLKSLVLAFEIYINALFK